MKKQTVIVFAASILVLEIFTIINSYVFNLKGATVDAEMFVEKAVEWTAFGELTFVTNAEFFIQFLGIVFLLVGPSEFIATQFGLLALIIAGVYFVKLIRLLGHQTPDWAVLAFFLWPSTLTRVTTTMREPYLILFILMIAFYVVRYKQERSGNDIIKLLVISFLALLFHKAFALLVVGALGYSVFFVMEQRAAWYRSQTFFLRVILGFVGVGGIAILFAGFSDVRGLQPLIALMSGDGEYITSVLDSKSSREFRTTYDVTLDLSSPLGFAISVPKVFVYYMFSPFPWQVSKPIDVLAATEGLFRLFGLFLIVQQGFIRSVFPRASRPMFMIVFMLILIWATGTTNYGTASRHHITTNWVFVVAYVLWLKNKKAARYKVYSLRKMTYVQNKWPLPSRDV